MELCTGGLANQRSNRHACGVKRIHACCSGAVAAEPASLCVAAPLQLCLSAGGQPEVRNVGLLHSGACAPPRSYRMGRIRLRAAV
jgi:hypothetical protein